MNPNIWIIWLTKSFVNFREEINKAYRKLAVLLHPDKSVAPGSEEAFKLLVAARTALLKSVQSWWIHSPNTRIDLHLDRPIFGSVQSWWLHSPNTRTDLHLGVSSLDDCIHQIPRQTYTWECQSWWLHSPNTWKALLKNVQSWWLHSSNTRKALLKNVQSWWIHSPNTRTDLHLGVSSLG